MVRNANDTTKINCLFCGKDFEPEDILFCDFSDQYVTDPSYDKAYQAFLDGIIPFDQIVLENGEKIAMKPRKKCYFHPWSSKNRKGKLFNKPLALEPENFDLYPDVIRVIRSNGFSPDVEAGLMPSLDQHAKRLPGGADTAGETETDDSTAYDVSPDDDAASMFHRRRQELYNDEPPFSRNDEARIRTKACPHCHCLLPENVGRYPTRRIVMLGSKRAGKTTYMTLSAHQLTTGIGSPAGLTERCQISEESERYFNYLIECIQADQLPATKLSNEKDTIQVAFPLVITVKPQNDFSPFFLVINDCPGEAMVSDFYLDNSSSLNEIEGAIIMMDPCQFSEMPQRKVGKDEKGKTVTDVCNQSFNITLNLFQARLREYKNLHHIVLALTKMDLIYGIGDGYLIKPGYYSHLDEPDLCKQHENGISLDWIDEMDYQISGAIKRQLEYSDFTNKKKSLHKEKPDIDVTALCCSTRNWQPGNEKFMPIVYKIGNDRIVNLYGYRLLEPLLCIMGRSNWIPVKAEKKRRRFLFW